MKYIFTFIILIFTSFIHAQTDEDQAEMEALLSLLEEETSIATKSKINSDYVPGMVTLLHGHELQALGIRTVWEALSLVPGIQITKDPDGKPLVLVRGLRFSFNSGNIKMMLNSVEMSRATSGINSSVLLLPIEQVDRIEFMRGPGSALYGGFAFMGLINIITHQENQRVFSRIDQQGTFTGGGQFTLSSPEQDLQFTANMAAVTSNDAESPITFDAEEERLSGIFSLKYKDTALTAQIINRDFTSTTTPNDSIERHAVLAMQQNLTFTEALNGQFNLSYLKNELDGTQKFKGDLIKSGIDFVWKSLEKHTTLFKLSFTHSNIEEAGIRTPRGNLAIIRDKTWRSYGMSLQDQWDILEHLAITVGARYDYRDDIKESQVTPRLAVIWRVAEQHILKAQYTEGFRPPVFFELHTPSHSNLHLDFETIDTVEVSYIYKTPTASARFTLFQSNLNQLIRPSSPGRFENQFDAENKGAELEWQQQFTPKLKGSFNLSYVDTHDGRDIKSNRTQGDSLLSAHWLTNLSVFAQPTANLLFTTHWYHVGDRIGTTENGDIEGFDSIDINVNFLNLFDKNLTVRAGIKNVLDDTQNYLFATPTRIAISEYPGRTWWLQFTYEF